MAGNRPVPQGAEIKIVWSKAGQPYALNVLHFGHDVGAIMTQAKADSIDSLVKTAFTSSAHNGHIGTGIGLDHVESRHMDSNTDPWYVGVGGPVNGVGTTDLLPDAVCLCVTLRTGMRGRSFNGRTYLWGFDETANDALGNCVTAASGAAVAFLSTISSNMASAQQWDLGVLSRFTTPAGSPPGTVATERNPPIITPVTAIIVRDSRWDTQRRRAVPGI